MQQEGDKCQLTENEVLVRICGIPGSGQGASMSR